MSRLSAWVILVASLGLIYSLAFTTYEQPTGAWSTTDSGGLVRLTIECPPPFQVLVFGTEPEAGIDDGECVPSSRTLAVEAGVVALAGGLLIWNPITRRKPVGIEPLSHRIKRPGSHGQDRADRATRDD